MKLGSGPITRMYLWLRKKQRKKRKQHGNVLLANADGLGRLIVKKGDNAPFLNYTMSSSRSKTKLKSLSLSINSSLKSGNV